MRRGWANEDVENSKDIYTLESIGMVPVVQKETWDQKLLRGDGLMYI